MLTYNFEENIFECSEEFYKEYITALIKEGSNFNETQLTTLIDTITNFINSVLAIYKHYLGSAIMLLKSLKNVADCGEDMNKSLLTNIVQWRSVNSPTVLKTLSLDITVPYQISLGKLEKLALDRLQSAKYINEKQAQEARKVMSTFLKKAIDTLESSLNYKKAQSAGGLYFNSNVIAKDIADTFNGYLPSMEEVERGKALVKSSRYYIS